MSCLLNFRQMTEMTEFFRLWVGHTGKCLVISITLTAIINWLCMLFIGRVCMAFYGHAGLCYRMGEAQPIMALGLSPRILE